MKIYKLPEKITTLIFDIDSTLYTNPEYAHEQIDSQVRYYADLNGMTHEEGRELIAKKRKEWAETHDGAKISLGNLLAGLGVSIEESVEWRNTLYFPEDYLDRDENLVKKINELSKKYKLVCVTNNPTFIARRTLEVIGISDFFPHIVGLDTLKLSKPNVKIFEKALELSDSKAENTVSIGDRYDIDLKLPLEMGMGAILVDGAEDVCKIEI